MRPSHHARTSSAAVLAAVLVLGTPLAAQAADRLPTPPPIAPAGLSACSSGQLCLWPETGYSGTAKKVTTADTVVNVSGTYRSLWNDRTTAVRLFFAADGGGSSQCFLAGREVTSLDFPPASVKLLSATSC